MNLVQDARAPAPQDPLADPAESLQTVFVLDDDAGVRSALARLLASAGYAVTSFASGADFLAAPCPQTPACLVLDVNMPALSGFDVMAALTEKGPAIPVIFITGFGTIPLSVQAMKLGAVEFLTKPVAPGALLDAVAGALALDAAHWRIRIELAELRQRHDSLTPRERETMELAIGGLLNKQIADALGVSEIMAKTHKRKVMEKMGARSLPDLVRAAERLRIVRARSR
ncbi:MAG: response regulator transcription factor [Massilia sp.]